MELLKAQNGATDEDFAVTDSLHSFFYMQKQRKIGWLYEVPVMEKKQSDDYLTGKKTIDLDKEEKNQLQDLESKAVAGSMFLDGEDDVTNVLNGKSNYAQPSEIRRRIAEDPLMQIRKKELEMTRSHLMNSQKIKEIVNLVLFAHVS